MRNQRGVAAITAILIVAVAASAAAMMLSQQSAMIDQSGMVAARAQAELYAHAGIDWARGVLAEDALRSEVDSLDEGWNRPVAALPVDRALVAGHITDEQGKFNLNNLVNGPSRSEPDMKVFRALLAQVSLPAELADAVADWIDSDEELGAAGSAESAYYLSRPQPHRAANVPMVQVEELYRVRGFDARAVALLKPLVSALPARTTINVNTAPVPVLAALLATDPERARRIAAARPYRERPAFDGRLASLNIPVPAAERDVRSQYFRVEVRVAQDEVQLETEALLHRPGASVAMVWRRPRY